ncbi:MAG: limonene-1,2-epoxide hydrolase family protein [Gammaproteobacteria bacterium]|nr:limonene-1,2-epoxide hydrolase family protein [Gammaproteobacteria bacterium]
MNQSPAGNGLNRRILLAGAAVAGISACRGGQMTSAEQPEKTQLEISNETLVTNFCRDWALRDIEVLRPYLAEDLHYQIAPGRPLIESRDQFEQQMGGWLRSLASVHWDILRSHVIGPVVINERIDHFNAPEEGGGPSMRFQVVGYFFIEDGVIKVWKDWPIPGAEQFIG